MKDEIDKFSENQLDRLVADILPIDAKPNEKIVVGLITDEGAQIIASFKFKNNWEIQAAAKHDWTGNNSVGAKILLRW
jgi:phosphorylcholine metabolism protein LicD